MRDATEDEAMRLAQESFPGQDIEDLDWIVYLESGKLEEVTCVVSGELKTMYPTLPIGYSEKDKFYRRLELYNRLNIFFIKQDMFPSVKVVKVAIYAYEFWKGRTACSRHSKPCADCGLQFNKADRYFQDTAPMRIDTKVGKKCDKLCRACLQKRLEDDELGESLKDDKEVVKLLRMHREMFGTISERRVGKITCDPRDVQGVMGCRHVTGVKERDAYFRKEKLFRQSAGLEAMRSLSELAEPSV